MCIRDSHTGAVNLNDGVGGGVDIGGQAAAVVGLGSLGPVSYTHLDVYKRQ